jgi:hypothetical protein
MSSIAYEELQKRIAEKLNVQIKEFHKTIGEISERFRNLGLETAVWYPEKIHAGNLGGIDADSYIGYSRLEGRWGKSRVCRPKTFSNGIMQKHGYRCECT